jgi:anti-sigma B factor antagonist
MTLQRSELEPFRCEVDPDRASVHVRPIGELDLDTAPVVDAQLGELWSVGFTRLVVDLRGVRFLDSTGLRLLLTWDAKSRADGVDFAVVPGPTAVQRVLEVAGAVELLTFAGPNGSVRG